MFFFMFFNICEHILFSNYLKTIPQTVFRHVIITLYDMHLYYKYLLQTHSSTCYIFIHLFDAIPILNVEKKHC